VLDWKDARLVGVESSTPAPVSTPFTAGRGWAP
jgi:hypothetical protein